MSGEMAGFADPVIDAAATFRAALDAMARPGRVHAAGEGLTPPAPMSQAAAAVLLTLADGDAPVWLAGGFARPDVARFLRFHTSAAPARTPGEAAFALGRWEDLRGVTGFRAGTPDYPDRSVTLIVEVDALAEGRGARLSGPGIEAAHLLEVAGVDPAFWRALAANRAGFPLGFDVILTAGARLAALPRTVLAEA
jgi:alpha-D-ribose 1-methylphosphonate 5-triphosphate synthase subunit PhnH